MAFFNEFLVWMFLAFILIFLTVIVLFRGISQRYIEPNKELKERVRNLERQVNELENNKN